MRPLVASNDPKRAHPNYTVDPATDPTLKDALDRLANVTQEEGLNDAEITLLKSQGRRRGQIDDSVFPKGADAALNYIRTNWAYWNDSQRLTLMLDYMPGYYKTIRNRYASEVGKYAAARGDLLSTLGYYCSYCEIPVGTGVHVEHKLPKRYFPAVATNWHNLLLACDHCNSNKGDHPGRDVGVAHPDPVVAIPHPPLMALLPNATEDAIQKGSWNSLPWPDDQTYPGYGVFSYRMMQVTYDMNGYRTSNNVIDPVWLENWVPYGKVTRIPPFIGKEVRGRFNGVDMEVELWMVPSRAISDAWFDRAQNMINFYDLNRTKKNDLRSFFCSDLRVPLRTDAWFKAVSAVPRLINAYLRDLRLQDRTMAGFSEMIGSVMDTAVSSGFWSVYRFVFETYIGNAEIRNAVLAPFYLDTYFPGTRPRT